MSGDSAEKAAKKHDLESRNILMHGTTPEPVVQHAQEITKQGPSTDSIDGMSRIQRRKELYAISNLILREIIPKVDQWIVEHPGVVPEYVDEITDVSKLFETIPVADAAARFHEVVRTDEGPMKIPDFGYGRVLLKHLIEWETTRDSFLPRERAIYDRFVSVINKYRPAKEVALRPYPASCFIWRGGNTASEFPWNIAKLVPVRWYQVTGKTITPEEFKGALNNIGTMLLSQS